MSVIDQATAQPSPLIERVRVLSAKLDGDGGLQVATVIEIAPENPIFPGHYPGLPIFPGICLVECAHQSVLAGARTVGVLPLLGAIETVRFRSPIFPGDDVNTTARITREPRQWLAAATLEGERGLIARVRLRYDLPGGDS